MARAKAPKVAAVAKAPAEAPEVTGPTSGVLASGPAGRAARERAEVQPSPTGWRDPNANYADDDNSIDARMWRLSEDHRRMNPGR